MTIKKCNDFDFNIKIENKCEDSISIQVAFDLRESIKLFRFYNKTNETDKQLCDNWYFTRIMLTTYTFKDQGAHNGGTLSSMITNIEKSHNIIPVVLIQNARPKALYNNFYHYKVIHKYYNKKNDETEYLINCKYYTSFDVRNKKETTYYTFKFKMRKKEKGIVRTYHFFPNGKEDKEAKEMNMSKYDKAVTIVNLDKFKKSTISDDPVVQRYINLLLIGVSDKKLSGKSNNPKEDVKNNLKIMKS
jgi:hypothetical protein